VLNQAMEVKMLTVNFKNMPLNLNYEKMDINQLCFYKFCYVEPEIDRLLKIDGNLEFGMRINHEKGRLRDARNALRRIDAAIMAIVRERAMTKLLNCTNRAAANSSAENERKREANSIH
jgi:ACT domain-containing protein